MGLNALRYNSYNRENFRKTTGFEFLLNDSEYEWPEDSFLAFYGDDVDYFYGDGDMDIEELKEKESALLILKMFDYEAFGEHYYERTNYIKVCNKNWKKFIFSIDIS